MPVYKMPHLQSWAFTEGQYALPAVGRHEILWVDRDSQETVATTPVHGQPVFHHRPARKPVCLGQLRHAAERYGAGGRQPHAMRLSRHLTPGKAILHMEFAPRGAEVWISSRDDNKVLIYDTRTREKVAEIPAEAPSGIFFTARAHQTGL
jgi:protein NirF